MAVDLRVRGIEQGPLVGGARCGDVGRTHHPDRNAFVAASIDVAGVQDRHFGVGGVQSDLLTLTEDLTARGMSPATRARRLSAIRQFYKFLYAENIRDDDPSGILDAPKKSRSLPKVLSIDDVSKLIGQREPG